MGGPEGCSAEPALWKDGFSHFIFIEEYDLFSQVKQPIEELV